jgi:hypothetical protein
MLKLLPLLLAALLALPAAAQDDLPRDVAGLRNERADDARRTLGERGYREVFSENWRGRTWQYWWNRRAHACLLAAVERGRIERFESTSETNCVPDGGDPGRLSAKGRVAVEAMRIVGVSSLRHRSHERDERKHGSPREVAAFEHGYRDGLASARGADGNAPRERDLRDAYRDGFRVAYERRHASGGPAAPTPPIGGGPTRPLPPADAPISALVGIAESQLEAQMRARGFVQLSRSGKGRDRGAVWQNMGTRQCIESAARDGVVTSFGETSEFVCR